MFNYLAVQRNACYTAETGNILVLSSRIPFKRVVVFSAGRRKGNIFIPSVPLLLRDIQDFINVVVLSLQGLLRRVLDQVLNSNVVRLCL